MLGSTSRLPALRTLALYSLALAFLGIVLWRSRIWDAGNSLSEAGPLTLAIVPLFSLLAALPLALREREILSALGRRFSAWRLAPISYYGNTAGFLTPASSAEVLRPALFERSLDVPASQGFAVVLFERLFSTFLLGVSAVLAFTWTGVLPWAVSAALLPLLLAFSLAPLVAYRRVSRLASRLRPGRLLPGRIRERFSRGLSESGSALERLWLSPRLAMSFTILSYLTFMAMVLQFWLLVEGMGGGISLWEAWVVLVVSTVAGVLSGLPLGLGATDAVMVSLLRAYGVDVPSAATIVLLMRCLINLPTGLLALLAYLAVLRQRAQRVAPLSPEKVDLVVEQSPF